MRLGIGATLGARLRRTLTNFARADKGNVALTFALATLPIIGGVGAAMDFSHANSVKAAMQAALDSTALMLSRDAATLSNADLQTKAMNYFKALFTRPEAKNIAITATYTSSGGSQVVVNGSATVDTSLMAIAGYRTMPVNGTSTAKWGSERLRVAMALDNTGSMADDGKMPALKSAAKSLLTQLKAAASTNGDVYVSIVPFSDDVNIGTSNYSASYIDWTDWDSDNTTTSCVSGRRGRTCSTVSLGHNQWNGCITDRGGSNGPTGQNYDQNVTAPGSSPQSKFPADQSDYCPTQMKGLSYDWTTMSSLIDSMSPAGATNQPIGLVWAWQSLVGGGPLSMPAKDSTYTYKEYIILMSDGLNTLDRWYGNGSAVSTSVDKRMYDSSDGSGTCANIKASGVVIYSIQLNTGGDPTSAIMKNCASDSDKFWEVKTAGDLGTVFTAIGTNLTKLRVAK
ncbi:MAG: TadE/TadG family protein, partial [Pseudolabrys sp.]|nr:TadE/TadG family protein [Pseudolabrys sp.]